MIKVHHLNRSRSLRILWLLEELDLPYEVLRYERDARTGLAPPELQKIHPLGKSPVIEMDGTTISESGAIVELICARHAPQMIPPRDSEAFIRHTEWMHFAEGSAMTPILLNLYVGLLKESGAPLQPRIRQQLDSHFSYMNEGLRASGHYVLDDLSAADIMLSFPAGAAIRLGRGADYPRLAEFAAMVDSRPAYQRALARAGGD